MTTAQREQQCAWITATRQVMKPGFHKCPVPTCAKQVQDVHLMCSQHWFKIPGHLQTSIYREYYAGLRRQSHPTALYTDYVQQALAHIAKLSAPVQGALHLHA
jgi:hypothetical protein